MRIILYLGKGGVGKTTTAAATALRCADMGYRTLVVSTDIAHSLADSLDVALTNEVQEIAPNLYAQEINVLEEIKGHWGELQGYVGKALRKQGMSKAIAEELAVIPGMEEVVSLLHINKQASEGNFDRVIVDAAPTGETMRLLTMPESFQWYTQRFLSWGETARKFTGGLITRFMPETQALDRLPGLVEGVKELQKTLTNPEITSYRVVVNPEKMVIKEGARAITYLSLFNYPVDAVVVNRILPGIESDGKGNAHVAQPSEDAYLRGLQETQAKYLGNLESDFYPLPLLRARWSDEEMVGLDALRGLANELYGERDPGEIFHRGHVQEIVEEGDDYVLKLTLPHMEMEKVRLTKRGDELFVTVGNFKRELLLPTMLAHRNASNATFRDGILHITFPPLEPAKEQEKQVV